MIPTFVSSGRAARPYRLRHVSTTVPSGHCDRRCYCHQRGMEIRKKAFVTLVAILSLAYAGRGSTMSGQMADFERVAHK